MIRVEHAPGRTPERAYLYPLVFTRFLGVACRLEETERHRGTVRLTMDGRDGEIRLPDLLLGIDDSRWLTPGSLPGPIERVVPPGELAPSRRELPLLFSEPGPKHTPAELLRRVDLLAAIFFLLTRYEEAIPGALDQHSRFPAWRSLACREGFLRRPVADECVDLLGRAIDLCWPGSRTAAPRERAAVWLTHDVDWPLASLGRSLGSTLRASAGDALKRRDPDLAIRRMRGWGEHQVGRDAADPFNTFDLIMELSERAGLRSTFFFIAGHTDDEFDTNYDLRDPRIGRLMQRIASRGHELGLHGSYKSYNDAALLRSELENLRRTSETLGIPQREWGLRQHFLRWSNPISWRAASAAGFAFDSTLSFSDEIGFRCGTARAFPVFDLLERRALALEERPLIVMDGALLQGPRATDHDVVNAIRGVKDECRRVGGTFTLLWHNSMLASRRQKLLYRDVLAELTS